jgi:hypothetical protein
MNRFFLKDNRDLILGLTLYSILAVFLLKYYMYFGGDEISYVNIAHAYAMGNWADAINGYWSPLYSWLISPFLLFGYTPIYAELVSKSLSLIIGFFTIIAIMKLSQTFKMDNLTKRALLFSSIPIVLIFALMFNTPDLLVTFILICYLSILFNSNYFNKPYYGILCGFTGAVAYFAKNYIFFFFLVHFILFNLIYYFKYANKRRNILKNVVLGLTVFFLISGVWIGALSEKYDELTISTAGDYNLAIAGPDYPTFPFYYIGLVKPPNKDATSIWDEPSSLKFNKWSPLDSWNHFEYELQLIWKNVLRTAYIIESFFMITIIILILSFLFIFRSQSKKARDNVIYLLITIGLYLSGYLLIAVEWRYFFIIFILLMLIGFYILNNFYKSRNFSENLRKSLLIILICGFTILPLCEIPLFFSTNGDYNFSNTLKNDYNIHGNIASDAQWIEMVPISYYLNTKYYGLTKETDGTKELQKELEDNDIDYYFVWSNSTAPSLSKYKEITNGKISGLKIYAKT